MFDKRVILFFSQGGWIIMVWTFSSAVEKACGINASSRFSYLVLFTGQSAFRIQEWNCGCSMREVAASKFLA